MNNATTTEVLSGGIDDPCRSLACVVLIRSAYRQHAAILESLVDQSAQPEIVLVNSGSGDSYLRPEPFEGKAKVIHHGDRLRFGAARNLGIRATTAPYVAFFDGDCAVGPDWAGRRITLHQQFTAVSSDISDGAGASLFALASHLLLLSERLPGAGDGFRLRGVVPYPRFLFDRHGSVREDLHRDEEIEFHRRLDIEQPVHHCVQADVQRPQSGAPWRLVRDPYTRGRRVGALFPGAGRAAALRVPRKTAVHRLRRYLGSHWNASAAPERLRASLAVPMIVVGAVAYGVGARAATPHRRIQTSPPANGDVNIYALLQVRNGMRYLPGYLDNLDGKVAGIIALDDGSTDGSREFLRKNKLVCRLVANPCREPHKWDEVSNRQKLVEAALSIGAIWVIAVDVDERLPDDFSRRLRRTLQRAKAEDIVAFYVWLRELWDQPDMYRVDGIWGNKRVARLFNVQLGEGYDGSELHGQWAPANGRKGGWFIQADLEIFHLNMIRRSDRLRRRRKYESLDSDRRWQAIGYEYLTDETNCLCVKIDRRAMYQPAAQGAEIDPEPPRILVLLAFHNEARYLRGYLANVAPRVDGIVALDDGSTDGSADMLRGHPKVLELLSNPVEFPHRWNEIMNQRRLLEAAGRHDPDWLLVVDADERLEKSFRCRANGLIWHAETKGVQALSLAFRELWGTRNTYRADGIWGKKRKASLFKYRRDHEFDDRPMHNYWAPLNSRINGEYAPADLELYHLRMIEPADRKCRYQRYVRMDPERKWQPNGYDYLVDETGLELKAPETGRHYF